MPWEALCLFARHGPVTTDPFGVRLRSLSGLLANLWPEQHAGISRDRDEGIVCPPGNRGTRRSSDLHEWRNDLGTVSTRDSAKLQYE